MRPWSELATAWLPPQRLSGDKMFDLERPLVTVSTLSTKDKKEISFSFASSKDLEKEISFS